MINKLTASEQENVRALLKDITTGKAVLGKDKKGRPIIQYHEQLNWDVSNANTIARPGTDEDDKEKKTTAFLEMIESMKVEKRPRGVLLDGTKIELRSGEYREGKDFENTEETLGKGNIAGDIKVVYDKKKKIKHALKIILLSAFRVEEIQAWVDINESGICPQLYLSHLEGNSVLIHMEILKKAITLRDITDTHMDKLWDENQELPKLFSLYIFHKLLDTVQKMHAKGWAHKDLHAGNAMLQEQDGSLKVKVLDFGQAQDERDDLKGSSENISEDVKKDYADIVKMFSGFYTGDELIGTNMWELWKKKLEEMPEKDRLEIEEIKRLMDVQELKDRIKKKLKHCLNDLNMDEESFKKTVIQILFGESKPMTGHDYNVNIEQADGVDMEKFNEETKKMLELRD
ncbi:hypothetical protein KUTeg_014728 [Tegillarca granosa]|uniref:Protein kinase domain-containing protein n=1 Tax=Tegillarca granosa TaxID=220873 RepID=A0ABQ9EVI6_TEGGR|nr:hypothetical protein KUTeg_014728 [Tegillarca granosa]